VSFKCRFKRKQKIVFTEKIFGLLYIYIWRLKCCFGWTYTNVRINVYMCYTIRKGLLNNYIVRYFL